MHQFAEHLCLGWEGFKSADEAAMETVPRATPPPFRPGIDLGIVVEVRQQATRCQGVLN